MAEEKELTPEQQQARADLKTGFKLYSDRIYQHAIAYFDKAIENDPKLEEALIWMGRSFLHLGAPEEYIECFNKAIEINPKNYWTHSGLGTVYNRIGELEKALEQFEISKELAPKGHEGDPYHGIGKILAQQGKTQEAEENLLKAKEIHPEKKSFLFTLGQFYFENEDIDKAEEFLEPVVKAVELSDEHQNTGNMILAKIYLDREDYKKAEKHVRNVPEIDPWIYTVRAFKAKIGFVGKKGEIEENIETLLEQNEKEPSAEKLNKIGIIYAADALPEAIANYEQSLEFFAQAYEMDRNLKDARENILTIIKMDPTSDLNKNYSRRLY